MWSRVKLSWCRKVSRARMVMLWCRREDEVSKGCMGCGSCSVGGFCGTDGSTVWVG